jgi:hypothetical protein
MSVKKICVHGNATSWVCDELEELKTMKHVVFGDTCYVVHESTKYILDSEGWWYPLTGDSDPIECDCVDELTIWGTIPEN